MLAKAKTNNTKDDASSSHYWNKQSKHTLPAGRKV